VTDIDPKLSRLYREASAENPPPSLDAAILAAARQQVAKPQQRQRPSRWRWMVPASVMATLVLGVSMTLLLQREHPELSEGTIARQMPSPQNPSSTGTAELAKAKGADSASSGLVAKKEVRAAAVPAQEPLPTPAAPTLAADKIAPAESRAKAAEANMKSEAAGAAFGGAARAPTVAAPTPAAAAGARSSVPQLATPRSAKDWLDEIRRLKDEGRDQEAATQLVEFRKAYPTHPVPEALLR
jgi:hypothetical protein